MNDEGGGGPKSPKNLYDVIYGWSLARQQRQQHLALVTGELERQRRKVMPKRK